MTVTENINEILGLSVDSSFELSTDAIVRVSEYTGFSVVDLERVIGHSGGSLSKASGFSLVFILQAFLSAVRVFESKERTREWMQTESIPLGGQPLDLLCNPIGLDSVRDELGRIEFGVVG